MAAHAHETFSSNPYYSARNAPVSVYNNRSTELHAK